MIHLATSEIENKCNPLKHHTLKCLKFSRLHYWFKLFINCSRKPYNLVFRTITLETLELKFKRKSYWNIKP